MHDRDNVINGLEIQLEDLQKYADSDQPLSLTQEQAQEIISLLKDQEAVEPKVSSTEQRCGNCNKIIEMDGWKVCPWCGKRIDWEGWWKKNGTCN